MLEDCKSRSPKSGIENWPCTHSTDGSNKCYVSLSGYSCVGSCDDGANETSGKFNPAPEKDDDDDDDGDGDGFVLPIWALTLVIGGGWAVDNRHDSVLLLLLLPLLQEEENISWKYPK